MDDQVLATTVMQLYNNMLFPIDDPDWFTFLSNEMQQPYFEKILNSLAQELVEDKKFYPNSTEIFKAFAATPLSKVKVVIIGQDPYPTPDKATGLAFAVPPNLHDIPASLSNIFKSIGRDEEISNVFATGDLTSWAEQGVFLLNTHLTVPANNSLGHSSLGWKTFTDNTVQFIVKNRPKAVFLLMGNNAQIKSKFIPPSRIIQCAHPSPHSAPKFFESTPFIDVNTALMAAGLDTIRWNSVFQATHHA
uniref:Uracil-DNA glycosylase n=1 Tax=Panagrellus redivivus TaxID=6233 RepID=A0A7E4ZSY1_PANRE